MTRHIISKRLKTKGKENILKEDTEKLYLTYRGKATRMTVYLSPKTIQAKRKWDIFFRHRKKRTVNPESYSQQKWKRNQDILR